MKRICIHIWRGLGSINLTIVLCSLLTLDLIWGYFRLERHTALFVPLNDMGLPAWIRTYGSHNLEHTGWFFLLLLLLTCLAANTFVCTTNRVRQLFAARRGGLLWLMKLAPHIMHYAVIIILAGYLCSYLCTEVLAGRTLVPGSRLSLPGASGQVGLLAFEPEYYHGTRLSFMDNEVITARAHLQLDDGITRREAVLGCTRPVRFQGYSLHLRNFAPKSLDGMKMKTRVDFFIRKDPGVGLYLAGMVLFTLGLLLYLIDWIMIREARKP
ncbi:MAG: hypothetical protein AB7E77_11395 [Desulfobulbus sp.]